MKFKTRLVAEAAMAGKTFGDRTLQLSWYTQLLPGKEGDEEAANETQELEQEEAEDDGYTPPQEDYLPPGLQEHEDSLSKEGLGLNVSGEAALNLQMQKLMKIFLMKTRMKKMKREAG